MNNKLQKQLFSKYPKIFIQKDLSITESCMPWGIDTDNGWYWLIDNLCSQLQWDINKNEQPQIEASQVKEKYGSLNFYTSASTEKQQAMITFAEFLSLSICEICGSTKDVTQNKEGWIYTLCNDCRKSEKK